MRGVFLFLEVLEKIDSILAEQRVEKEGVVIAEKVLFRSIHNIKKTVATPQKKRVESFFNLLSYSMHGITEEQPN